MAQEKSPAFQFYPKEFLMDGNVAGMTLAERGAYITLLCLCWQEGSLPTDHTRLARMLGIPAVAFRRIWPGVSACFHASVDGKLIHHRLEKERHKQEDFRRQQAENGLKGGRPRNPEKPRPFENETQVEAEKSSPISDLRSPLENASHSLETRAGTLRETLYPEWYRIHRHGAKLRLFANSLEFQDALTLVSTWDDARLEKLAKIVLTTDDPWISRTDRGFKIFAMKATWADEKLSAWEHEHQVKA